MKLIGKGHFSRAYLREDGKVLIKSRCRTKEALSMFDGAFSFLPEIERIDTQTYLMPYYPPTKGLKAHLEPDQWKLYQQLRRIQWQFETGYRLVRSGFCRLNIPEETKEQLIALLDHVTNWADDESDIVFEISPRNVRAVNGKLILMDVFFFESQIRKM